MTASSVLLPLRVPELGPSLGKVITGTGRDPGGIALDAVRHQLATRLFDAAGEARRLAARDERRAAVAAIGREAWLAAWEEAVSAVAALLVERAGHRLAAAARRARMSRRRLARYLPDPAATRRIVARLGAAAAGLVPALDVLERSQTPAVEATGVDRDAVDAWQDALRTAARRLDAAWIALEEVVEREWTRWDTVAAQVAGWRKPWWPVLLVGVLLLGGAVWLGLVLGGYLPPPRWLAAIWQRLSGA